MRRPIHRMANGPTHDYIHSRTVHAQGSVRLHPDASHAVSIWPSMLYASFLVRRRNAHGSNPCLGTGPHRTHTTTPFKEHHERPEREPATGLHRPHQGRHHPRLATQIHHPAEDLEYAATRYGRKVYDAYLRLHRTKPYTLRIGGSGPVKVYLPSDRPLLADIYTAWHEQERRRRSALKE